MGEGLHPLPQFGQGNFTRPGCLCLQLLNYEALLPLQILLNGIQERLPLSSLLHQSLPLAPAPEAAGQGKGKNTAAHHHLHQGEAGAAPGAPGAMGPQRLPLQDGHHEPSWAWALARAWA